MSNETTANTETSANSENTANTETAITAPDAQGYSRITDDEFDRRFRPEEGDEEGDPDDGCYHYYENWHDEAEWKFLLTMEAERRLWTWVDVDDGSWCVSSGLHRVNRVAYIVTAEPYPEGETIDVYDPSEPARVTSKATPRRTTARKGARRHAKPQRPRAERKD
jgi:hypothetical protein